MATEYSDSTDKSAQEAMVNGPPPPYTNEPPTWSYTDTSAPKAFESGVGYVQQPPNCPAYPTVGFSSASTTPGMIPDGAWLIREAPEHIIIQRQKESFVKQIILSCLVFWLCCWPLGCVAFILALMANSKADASDERSASEAHKLGVHSLRTSIAGIVIGTILIIVLIILEVV